jgi:hypothetical protein
MFAYLQRSDSVGNISVTALYTIVHIVYSVNSVLQDNDWLHLHTYVALMIYFIISSSYRVAIVGLTTLAHLHR